MLERPDAEGLWLGLKHCEMTGQASVSYDYTNFRELQKDYNGNKDNP